MHYASKTNIKVTAHGMQRMKERTSVSVRNEIISLVSKARFYGICVDLLDKENYSKYNIPYPLYKFAKKNVYSYRSDRLYLFRDHIFCFTGSKDKTLKTVINIPEEMKGWWKNG